LKPPGVSAFQRQSEEPLDAKTALGVGVNDHAPIAQERTESPPRPNESPEERRPQPVDLRLDHGPQARKIRYTRLGREP
jgi:hypothetical protein